MLVWHKDALFYKEVLLIALASISSIVIGVLGQLTLLNACVYNINKKAKVLQSSCSQLCSEQDLIHKQQD